MKLLVIVYFLYLTGGIIYAMRTHDRSSNAGCIFVFLSDKCYNLTDLIEGITGTGPASISMSSKAVVKIFAPDSETVVRLPLLNFTFT